MFSIFKKKSELEKLHVEYARLMKLSFEESKRDRTKGDAYFAEAEAVSEKIEALKGES